MRAKHLWVVALCIILLSSCKSKFSTSINVETLAKTSNSWNGDILPKYGNNQPEVTILKITIPPHTRLKEHKHPMINAGYLIKGTLRVVDENGKSLILNAGETLVELVNTFHYGENIGNKPAEILVFYAGTVNTPLSIKKKD